QGDEGREHIKNRPARVRSRTLLRRTIQAGHLGVVESAPVEIAVKRLLARSSTARGLTTRAALQTSQLPRGPDLVFPDRVSDDALTKLAADVVDLTLTLIQAGGKIQLAVTH